MRGRLGRGRHCRGGEEVGGTDGEGAEAWWKRGRGEVGEREELVEEFFQQEIASMNEGFEG